MARRSTGHVATVRLVAALATGFTAFVLVGCGDSVPPHAPLLDAYFDTATRGDAAVDSIATGDAGAETSSLDATAPDATSAEASGPEAADASDSAETTAACTPAALSGWSPPAYVHAAPAHAAACLAPTTVAADYFAACLDTGAGPDSCASFLGQVFPSPDAACLACLRSAEGAASYSAEVTRVVPTIDVAGCVQSTDGAAGLACAQSIQAVDACAEAACRGGCPVTDAASQTAYRACTVAARTSPSCASFASAADACIVVEKAKAATGSTCFPNAARDAFIAIADWFCGG